MEGNNINTGMIMDGVVNAPVKFEESKNDLKKAIDDQKMREAIAKYKLAHTPIKREYHINRNDPCPCGSGKKYKKCCLSKGYYEK